MLRRLFSLCCAAVLTGLLPSVGHADAADHEQARQALAAGEILPLRQVLERVEQDYPGQVLEVELEREQGGWVYEIKLLRPGGAMTKLLLDARDGRLLRAKGHGPAVEKRGAP